jgi:hypothetical protein
MLTYLEEVLERVTLFCDKYGVEVPSMDGNVPYGKSTWYACAKSEKKMVMTSEEKYIFVSSIKLVKSIIISLMRLI